jgi:hypothetical protein
MFAITSRTFARSVQSVSVRPAASGSGAVLAAYGHPFASSSRAYASATIPSKAEVAAGPPISQTNSKSANDRSFRMSADYQRG